MNAWTSVLACVISLLLQKVYLLVSVRLSTCVWVGLFLNFARDRPSLWYKNKLVRYYDFNLQGPTILPRFFVVYCEKCEMTLGVTECWRVTTLVMNLISIFNTVHFLAGGLNCMHTGYFLELCQCVVVHAVRIQNSLNSCILAYWHCNLPMQIVIFSGQLFHL